MNEIVQKLPELIPVQPEMFEVAIKADWNKASVQEYLLAVTERYKGLVVTDENVDDMAKTLREIVKLRTSLKSFKTKGIKQLKEPANNFSYEVDKLMDIVTDVELPLKTQLDGYEKKRQEELEAKFSKEIELKAQAAGLRDEFVRDFNVDSRWYNKTYKWSQICKDIDAEIGRLSESQRLADERAALIKERRDMAQEHINLANEKYGLSTPITLSIFTETDLTARTLPELKELIYSQAQKQHDIEQKAIEEKLRLENMKQEEQTEPASEVVPDPQDEVVNEATAETTAQTVDVEIVFHDVPPGMVDILYDRLDDIGFRYDVKDVR